MRFCLSVKTERVQAFRRRVELRGSLLNIRRVDIKPGLVNVRGSTGREGSVPCIAGQSGRPMAKLNGCECLNQFACSLLGDDTRLHRFLVELQRDCTHSCFSVLLGFTLGRTRSMEKSLPTRRCGRSSGTKRGRKHGKWWRNVRGPAGAVLQRLRFLQLRMGRSSKERSVMGGIDRYQIVGGHRRLYDVCWAAQHM